MRVPFYFINLLPTLLLYISILLLPSSGVALRFAERWYKSLHTTFASWLEFSTFLLPSDRARVVWTRHLRRGWLPKQQVTTRWDHTWPQLSTNKLPHQMHGDQCVLMLCPCILPGPNIKDQRQTPVQQLWWTVGRKRGARSKWWQVQNFWATILYVFLVTGSWNWHIGLGRVASLEYVALTRTSEELAVVQFILFGPNIVAYSWQYKPTNLVFSTITTPCKGQTHILWSASWASCQISVTQKHCEHCWSLSWQEPRKN